MRRVMLKLSGEALSGEKGFGFDDEEIESVCKEIKKAHDSGIEICVVVGGGNFIRGKMLSKIDKYRADEIGMLSTCMNAIYLSECLRNMKMKTYVSGGFSITDMIELFDIDKVNKKIEEGHIIIFGAGTGSSYFTTDTGVLLRAVELHCDELLLAKNIDGVYDKDPNMCSDAKKYTKLKINEMVEKKLGVIDLAASIMALDYKMNMRIFSLKEKNSISKAIKGSEVGTYIYANTDDNVKTLLRSRVRATKNTAMLRRKHTQEMRDLVEHVAKHNILNNTKHRLNRKKSISERKGV